MELVIEGRNGALTVYRIVGGAEYSGELPHTGYCKSVKNNDVVGNANKRSIQQIKDWIESKTKTAPVNGRSNSKTRYVELLLVAAEKGLNHGKSWRAKGHDIDKHQLHPQSEGEMICYVYE